MRPTSHWAAAALAVLGCAVNRSDMEQQPVPDAAADAPPPNDGGPSIDAANQDASGELPAAVYAHSPDTLYRLDPESKQLSAVGKFDGCEGYVADIALDEASRLFAVSQVLGEPQGFCGELTGRVYQVDRDTAKCTLLSDSPLCISPYSLSFVPAGTVEKSSEALVAFADAAYMKVEPATGTVTTFGNLAMNGTSEYIASGDIVSVKDGGTFVSVKGIDGSCDRGKTQNDCLVEIDPKYGFMIKYWGSLDHQDVWGLGYWDGVVYGFTGGGELFAVHFGAEEVTTEAIPVPNQPADLSFWGAGVTTVAPTPPH